MGSGSSSSCGTVSGNVCNGGSGVPCDSSTCDRYKGAVDSLLKASEAVQGRLCDRSMLKIEKSSTKAIFHGVEGIGKCGGDRMKSAQELGYGKHETVKSKSHDVGHGFKVENIKYYGELKGYDFKSYGTIDKPVLVVSAHEKSHLHGPEKNGHEKCHSKTSSSSAMQSYGLSKVAGERPAEKSMYADHYYHRSSHSKPQNAYQVYQETKYSYNVSGVPGTPAQASAAAAFFARSVTQSTILLAITRVHLFPPKIYGSTYRSFFPSHCSVWLSVIVHCLATFVYVTPPSAGRTFQLGNS